MACIPCGRELHYECISGDPCCCATTPLPSSDQASFGSNELIRGRPRKENIGISAGRKRAAEKYPIDSIASCEWRDKANCGGGLHPIIGCNTGKQKHRHHGPIKDTSHNEEGNVHLICATCHNRWHAKNDSSYDEETYSLLPHSPRPITIEEKLESGKS